MEKENEASKNSQNATQRPGEGLRSLKTSNVFRTLNFELYTRPVSITDKQNCDDNANYVPHLCNGRKYYANHFYNTV